MQDKVLQMAYSPLVQDQLKKVYASKKKKKKKRVSGRTQRHKFTKYKKCLGKMMLIHIN